MEFKVGSIVIAKNNVAQHKNGYIVKKGKVYTIKKIYQQNMLYFNELKGWGVFHESNFYKRVKNTELSRFMYENGVVSECGEWLEI